MPNKCPICQYNVFGCSCKEMVKELKVIHIHLVLRKMLITLV